MRWYSARTRDTNNNANNKTVLVNGIPLPSIRMLFYTHQEREIAHHYSYSHVCFLRFSPNRSFPKRFNVDHGVRGIVSASGNEFNDQLQILFEKQERKTFKSNSTGRIRTLVWHTWSHCARTLFWRLIKNEIGERNNNDNVLLLIKRSYTQSN